MVGKTRPNILLALLLSMIGAGCATLSSPSTNSHTTQNIPATETASLLQEEMFPAAETDSSGTPTINIVDRPLVSKWIDYFVKKDKTRFQNYLARGSIYRDVVQTILKENSLPIELFYLALIESGYSNHAHSTADAVGTWQFLKGTAKNYRLEVNKYVDERRDPIRATEAASKYLADLYTAFQSWELALAAYNCGQHRLLGAMMKGNERDFWKLSDKGLIPKQTQNYVPKFIAAILIGENAEEYGLTKLSNDAYPSVELVEVPSPVKLASVAELSGVPLETLQKVNPHLLQGITSPYQATYELWVPTESVETVRTLGPKLAEVRLKGTLKAAPAPESESGHFYTVKKGDNLAKIANRFGISLVYLKNLNGKKSHQLQVGEKLRVSSTSYHPKPIGRHKYHLVKAGQNLSSIARRYHTTPAALRKANNLKSDSLKPGQKLKVKGQGQEQEQAEPDVVVESHKEANTYTVKPGDTLRKIAHRTHTKVKDLRRINGISGKTISPGQVLKLN